jgi:hypothetical protein
MDWTEEAMAKYGLARIEQGTANGSPLLTGDEKPEVDFNLLAWQPPENARPQ